MHTAVVSASSSLKSLLLSSLHIAHCIGKTGCPPSSSKHNKSVSPLLSPAPPLCSDAQLHVGCQPFDTTIDRTFPLHSQNEHTPALITYFSSKLVCLCVFVSYCVCSECLNHSSLCLLFLDSQMSIVGGNMHKLPQRYYWTCAWCIHAVILWCHGGSTVHGWIVCEEHTHRHTVVLGFCTRQKSPYHKNDCFTCKKWTNCSNTQIYIRIQLVNKCWSYSSLATLSSSSKRHVALHTWNTVKSDPPTPSKQGDKSVTEQGHRDPYYVVT